MLSDFKSGSAQRAYGDRGYTMDSDSSIAGNSVIRGIVWQITFLDFSCESIGDPYSLGPII